MVEPSYKPIWEIPGGAVELGESPPSACMREINEELGLAELTVGRLLVIDHQQDPLPRGDSLMLIYDLGVMDDPASMTLDPAELKSYAFVDPEHLIEITSERLARRVREAMAARAEDACLELVDGIRRR